jgi:hypothetical protein
MAQVKFSGTVSAQAQEGETVIITVTKPDSTLEDLVANTLADKTFETTKQYAVAGAYSVTFHIDADGEYKAADFGPVSFNVELADRTITATISVA